MKHLHFVAFILFALMACVPGWAWEFNAEDDKEGWIPSHIADLQAQDGKLVATVAPGTNDPYITGPLGPWDANDITGILLRARVSTDVSNYSGGAGPAIYYFNPGPSAKGFLLPDPNEWGSILVDMAEEANWTGTINNIRVDLADNVPEEYTVEIDWIRFMGLRLNNESFELWDDVNSILVGWDVIGGEFADLYDAYIDATVEPNNVYSLGWAVKHLGTGAYHALSQPIKGGLDLEKGMLVTLRGALRIPAEAWDDNASIWFRIRESDGTTERLSDPIEMAVLDEWFEFESTLELAYSPAERQTLDVQLYGRIGEEKFFYFDDIFVEVGELEFPDEDLYWPYNQTHWEFEMPGDTEGWSAKNDQDITFFDVNMVDVDENPTGALLMDLPAGTFDPYMNGPAGPYYASQTTGVAARMRLNGSDSDMAKPADGGQHTVYWFYVAGGHGNSVQFEIPAANQWFIAYIDCSDRWAGWVNSLRLDFGHYQDYMMVDIDWIRTYGQYLQNNGFEEALEPWSPIGAGFSVSADQVQTGQTALKIEGQGIGVWHAVEQHVAGWDTKIPRGARITVRGSYYVPATSWAEGALLWLRVNELLAGTASENIDPDPLAEPVLDAWTPFEASITTQHEPGDRGHLSVQLFSQTPAGTPIYVDDVFVEVVAQPAAAVSSTWPVNCVRLAAGQEIAIDGSVSAEEYSGAQPLTLNAETLDDEDPYFEGVTHQGTIVAGAEDNSLEDYSGTFYFMWDDEYLYAAASVTDDNYTFSGPGPNASDCLQFVLGAGPEETATANMFIPTIAADGGASEPVAQNVFDGWIAKDIMAQSEYAAAIDPDTQDWTVEVKIPWTALQGTFDPEVFPPAAGEEVGFSLLGIDYDNGAQEWFGCIEQAPWTGAGLQTMTFIEQ